MPLLVDLKKDRFVLLALICSLFLGVLVRTANLSGSRFLNPDEYRTLIFDLKSPVLKFVYSLPPLLFKSWFIYDAALFSTAFWGIMNILLVYLIGKASFNDKVGGYSALILSVSGYHVYYSRTGFASILQTFFLLLGYYLFLLSIKGGQPSIKNRYLFVCGLMFGLSFLTYAVSYAPIASLGIMAFVVFRREKTGLKKTLIKLSILGSGGIIALSGLEIIARLGWLSGASESFFSFLFRYQHGTALYAPKSWLMPLWFFKETYIYGGVLQIGLIILAWGYCLYSVMLKKEKYLSLLTGFTLLSYAVFSLTALMGAHSIYPRKYLFLVPFACIGSGYFLYEMEKKTSLNWLVSFLVILVGVSLVNCTDIINQAFKITPITSWLKQHDIKKNQVITVVDLYEQGDPISTAKRMNQPDFLNKTEIDWNKVSGLYYKKNYTHLLISGIGQEAKIGYYDKVLKKIAPLKIWPHPYHRLRPWLFDIQDFAVYELKTIFMMEHGKT